MKKLFTLAAAILASFSMWAAETELFSSFANSTKADYFKTYTVDGQNVTAATPLSISSSSGDYFVSISSTPSNNASNYVEVSVAGGYTIKSVSFALTGNGSNKECQPAILGWTGTISGNDVADYVNTSVTKTVSAKGLANAEWFSYDVSGQDLTTIRLYRAVKGVKVAGADAQTYGNGQTVQLYGISIELAANCTDPEFTVPEGGTGFVGDPIDLAITSKNNSKPVKYAVTVDGVEGVNGTDYSFNVSPGLVQATPLRAGTFVITFTQASNGTYCDAEESATFVISAKNPVTSFEIDAPATAHVGEEVTIELKNFDAAPTTIVWYDGALTEITAANGKTSYTFTPEAAGEYVFQITAWNDYNKLNEEAFNYTQINVVVGTDATLSDLKVNGATIDGFAADKYEYNVELGVYEAINVVATAADAPYASAEVVDNGEGKITITVTAQNKSTQDYVINYTRGAATELASISESTTWDWSKAGSVVPEFKDDTKPTKTEEFNFADVLINPDAEFNAAALVGIAQFANRSGSYFQGNMVKFNTTVAGTVVVTYSNTGGSRPYRHVKVNEKMSAEGSADQDKKETEAINVAAGEVAITFYIPDASNPQARDGDVVGASMGRIYKIVFTKDEATALDNTEASVKAVKFFQNGQLFIEKNGVIYNAQGIVAK